MQSCFEISMGFLASTLHTKFITHYTIYHTSLVLATKQTLLSILLVNHALLETYLQDEDSQMDTQSKLEEPLVNA